MCKNALKTKQYRKRKEIYQVNLDTIKEVVETCDDLINFVKKVKNTKTNVKILSKAESNLFLVFLEKK